MYPRHNAPRHLARRTLGLSLVLSIVGVTSGVGVHAAGRSAAPLTLAMEDWAPAAADVAMYQPCEKKLHMSIKFAFVPRTGYEAKLQTQFAAGAAPDIYDAPPEDVEYYSSKGQALDLLPYLKAMHLPYNNVPPQAQFWAGGKVGGKLLTIVQGMQSMYIFYNKDVFKQAGVAPPPHDAAHAWTWSQFVAVAKKLTVDRQGRHPGDKGFDSRHIQRYGINIPLWYAPLLPLIQSNGGSDFDKTGTHFTMNQPAAADVIQDVADLALKYHVMPTPSQFSSGAGSITLASGRLGMEFNGNWQVYTYGYPKSTFSWGIGVLPRFKQYRGFYFAGSGFLVSPKTAHPREAALMDYCLSYQGLSNYQTGIWVPASKNLLYGSGYRTWADNRYHPEYYRSVVVDTIKDSPTPPFNYMTQFGPLWLNQIPPALDKIFAGQPAQTVLTQLKPQIDAMLASGAR